MCIVPYVFDALSIADGDSVTGGVEKGAPAQLPSDPKSFLNCRVVAQITCYRLVLICMWTLNRKEGIFPTAHVLAVQTLQQSSLIRNHLVDRTQASRTWERAPHKLPTTSGRRQWIGAAPSDPTDDFLDDAVHLLCDYWRAASSPR